MMAMMLMRMGVRAPTLMLQLWDEHYKKEQELIVKYGKWEVKRAMAVCPRHDWECITREASRLSAVLRARYG